MNKDFAVFKIGSTSFKACQNDEIISNKIEGEVGKKIVIDKVLLVCKKGEVKIGTPYLKQNVEAEIVDQKKGKKIKILKYKAKSRYKKRRGHRQLLTVLKINKF